MVHILYTSWVIIARISDFHPDLYRLPVISANVNERTFIGYSIFAGSPERVVTSFNPPFYSNSLRFCFMKDFSES